MYISLSRKKPIIIHLATLQAGGDTSQQLAKRLAATSDVLLNCLFMAATTILQGCEPTASQLLDMANIGCITGRPQIFGNKPHPYLECHQELQWLNSYLHWHQA